MPEASVGSMSRSFRRPSGWIVAKAVGRVTASEVLRDKVLYNIILCAVLLLAVGFLASRLTFLHPDRVILDFGVSAVNISCAMIAIFTGASLLGREFERRTISVALSHPISRSQFVLGKFLGIAAVIGLNWFLLSATFLAIYAMASPAGIQSFSGTLGLALFFIYLQSVLISAVAILFSTFSTTSLSVIFAIGVYLIGNNVSQIRWVASRLKEGVGRGLLNGVSYLLPNFEYFNLGTKVTYGIPVTWQFTLTSVAYAAVAVALVLALAGLLVQQREI